MSGVIIETYSLIQPKNSPGALLWALLLTLEYKYGIRQTSYNIQVSRAPRRRATCEVFVYKEL